ncbi:flagellar biosynthetic protein FliO [Sanguibacter hominis ATCC BAA-789]|uniref:Flagellar biosynthetic protein FliO n=1 Tax=Sanguibacter hominis ATCC BAA-789 TaxID=1312740 RepID=A0A9X5FBS7_9MICO|nr:flagellar biosynthetic protein FliO [Sanguibacter hominis]NKX93566.1 flagellar biosynthetic protein FliO [Sanguibacter hominis ATCC BAA-789]
MGDTVVVLLRALVSLGVVLGLIWWAGRRLSSGKGPVGGSATGPRAGRATGALGRGLGRVRDALRGGGSAAQAPAIVVLGKQALTPKAGLALVEVGGRRLLLGVGEQGVTVLDTQDAPAAQPAAVAVRPDGDLAREATPVAVVSESGAVFAAELDHAVTAVPVDVDEPAEPAARVAADDGDAQVLSLTSRGSALDGSILSPTTWRRAATALQQGRR